MGVFLTRATAPDGTEYGGPRIVAHTLKDAEDLLEVIRNSNVEMCPHQKTLKLTGALGFEGLESGAVERFQLDEKEIYSKR